MDRAVVTLCLGESYDALARQTWPFLQAYAKSVQADLLRIDRAHGPVPTPHFEKYQVRELLERYERVLYVDADVLVAPGSPDLFAIVPEDEFGAYLASRHSEVHDASIAAIQAALGELNWERDYFNSGVMLVGRVHRDVFDFRHGAYVAFFEQTQLNYNVRKLGLPMFDITFRFNHVEAAGGDRLSSHFIHYAGPGHGLEPKPAQIARDAALLAHRRDAADF